MLWDHIPGYIFGVPPMMIDDWWWWWWWWENAGTSGKDIEHRKHWKPVWEIGEMGRLLFSALLICMNPGKIIWNKHHKILVQDLAMFLVWQMNHLEFAGEERTFAYRKVEVDDRCQYADVNHQSGLEPAKMTTKPTKIGESTADVLSVGFFFAVILFFFTKM